MIGKPKEIRAYPNDDGTYKIEMPFDGGTAIIHRAKLSIEYLQDLKTNNIVTFIAEEKNNND